jgi:chaperonin cofactor prefoldin
MDLEDLDRELNTIEYIRDVRIYRFRKEMHELDEDMKKLKQELKEKSGELSEVPTEELVGEAAEG